MSSNDIDSVFHKCARLSYKFDILSHVYWIYLDRVNFYSLLLSCLAIFDYLSTSVVRLANMLRTKIAFLSLIQRPHFLSFSS